MENQSQEYISGFESALSVVKKIEAHLCSVKIDSKVDVQLRKIFKMLCESFSVPAENDYQNGSRKATLDYISRRWPSIIDELGI